MEKSNKVKKQTTPSPFSKSGQQMGSNKKIDLEKLKIEAQSWSPEQWEEHLQSTEGNLKEDYLDNANTTENVVSEDYADLIYSSNIDEKLSKQPRFKRSIKRILSDHLTPAEQRAVWKIYWENMTQRQAAEALGVSRRAVRLALDQAHRKITFGLLYRTKTSTNKNNNLDESLAPNLLPKNCPISL